MEVYCNELTRHLSFRNDVKIWSLPGKKNGRPPNLVRQIVFIAICCIRAFVEPRRDIVHVGDLVSWPIALPFILRRSCPVFITAYGLDIVFAHRAGLFPWLYRKYLGLCVRMMGDRLNVVAISRATALLCEAAGFSKVAVVPLGVNLQGRKPFAEIDNNPEVLGTFILFVGRLVQRKGASWFAEHVLPHLPQDISLKVVGAKWDDQEWSAISSNPRTEYLGTLSNERLARLRRAALVVIMPNISSGGTDIEGFGLTALEAAVDGGVLVASAIEGIVDAVIPGETGFLVPERDVSAWLETIASVARWSNEERGAFIERAFNLISERYSWDRVAKNTESEYESATYG
ncbi:glycosyltransferase family 4 protein [Mesorhizobium sp.]|nr:glycosyltransferase family 4 protein [Mesorhizobium sp.]